jgi:dienelactone hydrolase
MDMLKPRFVAGFVLLAITLAGCAQTQEATPTQEVPPAPTVAPPSSRPKMPPATPSPTTQPAPDQTITPGAPPPGAPEAEALPPEPQAIEFQASDGQILSGRYYPAAVAPAPLVVLMHWAPGDQNEWPAIASWLQNRGLSAEPSADKTWLDASWFPPMLEGQSFAVFTFTFRNCDGGCRSFSSAAWLLDARAAMLKARELEGVDPSRIVAIGASIGADGAADGCVWLNATYPDSCLAALSLSPGGYLTIPYRDAVDALGAEATPKPAWCLYAEGDGDSKRACEDARGDNYTPLKYSGNYHGLMLIAPEVEPGPLGLILKFLQLTFGL